MTKVKEAKFWVLVDPDGSYAASFNAPNKLSRYGVTVVAARADALRFPNKRKALQHAKHLRCIGHLTPRAVR